MMSRFQKLTLTTAVATYLLIVVGVIVRSTNSGLACPDWPLCYGKLLPPLDNVNAWLEWIHRALAASIGLLVLWVAICAWRGYRDRQSIVWPSSAAAVVVAIQAILGKITVESGNSGQSVTAHLATALVLLGLLTYLALRAGYPATLPPDGAREHFTFMAASAALSIYVLVLFGARVTATGAALVFPDWPLFNGEVIPRFNGNPDLAAPQLAQFLHRLAALVVGTIVLGTTWVAVRTQRTRRTLLALVYSAAMLYVVEVFVGMAQIFTTLAAWAVVLHLALGTAIWILTLAAAIHSYYLNRGPILEGLRTSAGDRSS